MAASTSPVTDTAADRDAVAREYVTDFVVTFEVGVPALKAAPPYIHQTTEFTCGPACIMMALAWADRSFKPEPAFEFRLWRESTTIFMSSGPGGCAEEEPLVCRQNPVVSGDGGERDADGKDGALDRDQRRQRVAPGVVGVRTLLVRRPQ